MTLDNALHIVSILASLVSALLVYTKMIRWIAHREKVEEEYPPHSHLNGHIKYPKGMAPDPLKRFT